MMVYLIGKGSSNVAFKITTAKIVSNVDDIIKNAMAEHFKEKSEQPFNEWIADNWSWSMPKIYTVEIDSDNVVKKMNKNLWLNALEEYAERHPAEYAKFELLKK